MVKLTPEQVKYLLSNISSGEELENAMEILKEHEGFSELLQQEWNETSADSPVPEAVEKRIWLKIRKGTKDNVHKIWWWAAAIFVITASIPFLWHTPTGSKEFVVNNSQAEQPLDTTIWHHGAGKSKVTLPDGTKIVLFQESSIRFKKNFAAENSKKRDVFVSGDVYFDVAHDAKRPLTVYTGILSTRVLGTSFQVTQKLSQIRIRLYTGRILISSEVENLQGWKNDLAIKPGTEVSYKKENGLLAINKFNSPEVLASQQQVPAKEKISQESILFNNESLSTVFDRLSEYYNVKIGYDQKEVGQKHFSGKIFRTDSVIATLALIAELNDLMVTGSDREFIIKHREK